MRILELSELLEIKNNQNYHNTGTVGTIEIGEYVCKSNYCNTRSRSITLKKIFRSETERRSIKLD
jgi:hypothetical protein